MSADLLAAFGPVDEPQVNTSSVKQSISAPSPVQQNHTSSDNTTLPQITTQAPPSQAEAGSSRHLQETAQSIWTRDRNGSDVLFDANAEDGNFAGDDDFGDFESGNAFSPKRDTFDLIDGMTSSAANMTIKDQPDGTNQPLRLRTTSIPPPPPPAPTSRPGSTYGWSPAATRPSSGLGFSPVEGATTPTSTKPPLDINLIKKSSALALNSTLASNSKPLDRGEVDSDSKAMEDAETRYTSEVPVRAGGERLEALREGSMDSVQSNDWGDFDEGGGVTEAPGRILTNEPPTLLDFASPAQAQFSPDIFQRGQAEAQMPPLTASFNDDVQKDAFQPSWDDNDFQPWDSANSTAKAPEVAPTPAPATAKARAISPEIDERPTNLPPPSSLLPLFPPLFDAFHLELLNTSLPEFQTFSSSTTQDLVNQVISASTVAAHVLAGRKLRWKRDAILAQSMSIGQAHSGKTGGMKLTKVDKSESLREDREAADLLQAWKRRVGQFRTAVKNAGSEKPLPEIAETLHVRTLDQLEGGVQSSYACALCGLKRDERVDKADVRVEDSFGEWWAEHWGHLGCKRFWEEHKTSLRQR